jgi:serine/threonine-protein kinase
LATPPAQIDKYEIVRRIGHGGMGTVYLARDPDLDRLLAIKVLRDPLFDEELLQRFFREARAAAHLRHDNIITVYDVGQHEHQPFMAMEYVDGHSLADVIRGRQPLTLGEKLSYLEQICAGLHFAHGQGIVHRDVKPANLMVDRHGVIRVLDFGIARVEGSGMTRDGALIGTLSYMSPEQMLGRAIDHRSDVFALGAVAYELLAYQQAFPGTLDDGLLQRLPFEAPPPLADLCPGLPDGLETIVMRALEKSPDARFASLDQARLAIREIRRHVDPNLELEPITVRSSGSAGAKGAHAPSSASDRRELLERRARQITVHRDAARLALSRDDIEGAVAACEDALTLDPDDAEALRLLEEIQQTRNRRAQQIKERHERERATRQHLADAELRLARGDVSAAAAALQQALALEPQNEAARRLLPQVRNAADTASIDVGSLLPAAIEETVLVDRGGAATPSRRPEPLPVASSQPERRSKRPVAVVVAAAAIVVVGAIVWYSRPTPRPTEATQSAAPSASVSGSADAPAADVARNAPPVAPPADRATAGTPPEAPAAALPPPDTATAAATAAKSSAERAMQSMTAAAALATDRKAATLDRGNYDAGEQARRLAERAFSSSDYALAERQATTAADAFRRAARTAAAAEATPAPLPAAPTPIVRPPVTATASGPVTATPPPPAPVTGTSPAVNRPPPVAIAAPAPPAVAPPASAPPPAAAAAVVSAMDRERPGMLEALTRYQNAYRERSIDALRKAYPSIPREMAQALQRAFRDCRDYDVALGNMQFALSPDDPTYGTVVVRSTYVCQPKSAQAAEPRSMNELFELRKVAGAWVIENAGAMNARRSQ